MLKRVFALLAALVLMAAFCAASAESEPFGFTLKTLGGREVTLESLRGKVVLLNFWTTWCPYCITEMPDFETFYHETGENEGDVAVFGIASPAPDGSDTEDLDGIIAFLEEKGVTYPHLVDDTNELMSALQVYAYPTTFVINRDGSFLGYVAGALSLVNLHTLLEKANEAVPAE